MRLPIENFLAQNPTLQSQGFKNKFIDVSYIIVRIQYKLSDIKYVEHNKYYNLTNIISQCNLYMCAKM